MVSQAELISKCYHSLVPSLILIFIDSIGPFKKDQHVLFKGRSIVNHTKHFLNDKLQNFDIENLIILLNRPTIE